MALSKVTYVDGVTIIGAKNLNEIQDEIILQGQKQEEDEATTEAALALKADKTTTYTKTEVDSALALKADKSDTYTKAQMDASLALKADKSDTFTKAEVNSALALKADKSDTYTKAEVDASLALKADSADVNADIEKITKKLTLKVSNNLLKSDNDMTVGYIGKDGTVYSYASYMYTPKIPVSEGDVIRIYGTSSNAFNQKTVRELCAYNSSEVAVSSAGGENIANYTVPSGISFVVLTIAVGSTGIMVTKNYVPSAYEEYFNPYYIATEDFIEEVLNSWEIPEEPVDGYNLYKAYEYGTGMYEVASGKPKYYNYSTYRYAIIPIEPHTIYFMSLNPNTWAITDDENNAIEYANLNHSNNIYFFNSGNATKLFYSISSSFDPDVIIAKGINGAKETVEKPKFISGITQRMLDAKYGCAYPKKAPYFTVGISEKWYEANALAIPSNFSDLRLLGYVGGIKENDGYLINPTSAGSSSNGYGFAIYDSNFAVIDNHSNGYCYKKADNLQSCSALVIGDSTVEQNKMTQGMLDAFTARSKTLTLIGTRGTAPNNHEGRAGWSAKDYCTEASKGGVTNPFYNPITEKFDFGYYMTNQNYTAPDFVVLQLGINDLYNASFARFDSIKTETAGYMLEMIESILTYKNDQKILLNLPVAINSDQSKHTMVATLVRNMVIRYNEYMMLIVMNYKVNIVRTSYVHLILDPTTDIFDDVHPTTAGYEKMANEVVSQINCWQN